MAQPYQIEEASGLTVEGIRAKLDRMNDIAEQSGEPIGVLVVDYLQLVIASAHPADALLFVRRRQDTGHIDWWAVEDGSDFRADFAMGENMGREYLDFIGRHPTYGHCLLLGHIVAGMAHTIDERGRLGASATGFLRIVNEHAMASATILSMPEIDHA